MSVVLQQHFAADMFCDAFRNKSDRPVQKLGFLRPIGLSSVAALRLDLQYNSAEGRVG